MTVNYEELIFQEIGQIIKTMQYIEWNLLNRIGIDTFENKTLGQIIGLVEREGSMHQTAITKLEEILRKHNDLVHLYFKRKDFEKHSGNIPFLQNELRYLQKFNGQVNNFNARLVKLPAS